MRTRRLGIAIATAAGVLALACAGIASAQLGDVGEQNELDTDYTPWAKESERWQWWAGAKYRDRPQKPVAPQPSDVPAGAATLFELDFFDVAFHGEDHGFAGAAECAQRVDGADGEAPAAPDRAETAAGAGWSLPLVVSSTVGGEFAEAGGQGGGGAEDGFWRGYQVVRRDVSGDPSKTIAEQRPVLGWVAIRAQERKLRPRQRMTLRGYGREAYGQDTEIGHLDITCSAQ